MPAHPKHPVHTETSKPIIPVHITLTAKVRLREICMADLDQWKGVRAGILISIDKTETIYFSRVNVQAVSNYLY